MHAGIAYWVMNADEGSFSLADQGYVAALNEDVLYPAIGVGPLGNAVMTFTLTGWDYFPSTGFGFLTKSSHGLVDHRLYVVDLGISSYDGLVEYQCKAGISGCVWSLDGATTLGLSGRMVRSTSHGVYPSAELR